MGRVISIYSFYPNDLVEKLIEIYNDCMIQTEGV